MRIIQEPSREIGKVECHQLMVVFSVDDTNYNVGKYMLRSLLTLSLFLCGAVACKEQLFAAGSDMTHALVMQDDGDEDMNGDVRIQGEDVNDDEGMTN